MSISEDILDAFKHDDHTNDVVGVNVNKDAKLHGEDAVEVMVTLFNGAVLTGTFTKHPRAAFGGVEFAGPKDIAGLMIAKIESVLRGTAE